MLNEDRNTARAQSPTPGTDVLVVVEDIVGVVFVFTSTSRS